MTGQEGRTVLYYPTIDIPTGSWLRQALCYWDQVGSIVPRSYDDWADEQAIRRYEPHIQNLYEEGVFRPFNPDQLISSNWFDHVEKEFTAEFKATVNNPRFKKLLSPLPKRKRDVQVYKQKVTGSTVDFLEKQNLVEERQNDYWCLYFERNTALLYMSLLAKYLARVDKGITVPSTDNRIFEQFNFRTIGRADASIALSTYMKDILPVPSNDVSFEDILKFKRTHREQLLNFRSEVDEFQSSIQSCEDIKQVDVESVKFREKIERQVGSLRSSMQRSSISTVLGSLQSFIKPNSPTLIGTAAVLAGKATSLTTVPVSWVISGAVTAGTIEVAAHLIKKSEEKADAIAKSPYSYVYLAEKNLMARPIDLSSK